jgi:hypothetical protein
VSGIALFDEPPRVSIKGLEYDYRNGLLLGVVQTSEYGVAGLVLVEDGGVTVLPLNTFLLDWRYNAETDQWVDVSMPKPEQVDSETGLPVV